jgi:protein TonB
MRYSIIAVIGSMLVAGSLAQAQDAPIRVAEQVAKQAAIEKVVPDYPPMARQLKLAGRVEIEALIDTAGNVEKTQVVSGNPLLTSAAVAALKKWKFTPFNADGRPYRAVTTITFDFKL